ncbi:hypothetical protein [Streptomyces sp. B8F3]|uniref:hypothetical protein n=1 Tax=unclassified Streptomyces TaxID=2593676 RepID=UPI00325EFE44
MPRRGYVGLKAGVSVAFAGAGTSLLLAGPRELLPSAALFLSGGLLFLGEVATVRANPLVPLMCIVCGSVGVVAMV